jgi:hypothetical protein
MVWDNFDRDDDQRDDLDGNDVSGRRFVSRGLSRASTSDNKRRRSDDEFGATFDSLIGRQISGQSIVVDRHEPQ